MSFWPFPKTLLAELRAGIARGPAVEVGAGSGVLARRLEAEGIPLLRTDRQPPADVLLDARSLPFGRAKLGLVVAANLMRHLGDDAGPRFVAQAAGCLAPRGSLLLLEDHPVARNAAEENYRVALQLLAEVAPGRGPALDVDRVLALRPEALSSIVIDEVLENGEAVHDPFAPVRWLAARGGARSGRVEELRVAVERHGMEYGRFRACVLRRGTPR